MLEIAVMALSISVLVLFGGFLYSVFSNVRLEKRIKEETEISQQLVADKLVLQRRLNDTEDELTRFRARYSN